MKQYKFILKCMFFAFSYAMTSLSYAINPPHIVWRMDTREPSSVFASGFSSWSDDDSIQNHASDSSILNHTSAFIGTSSDMSAVLRIATNLMRHNVDIRNSGMWLYRIRASDNFYSIADTLHAVAYGDADTPTNGRDTARDLYQRFARQQEWAALRSIPSTQIHSAQHYIYNSATRQAQEDGQAFSNQNYNEQATTGNASTYPYHGRHARPDSSVMNAVVPDSRIENVSLSFCPSRNSSSFNHAEAYEETCNAPQTMTFAKFNSALTTISPLSLSGLL